MNKTALLKKHEKRKEPKMRLSDNSVVIASEVDEENKLWYVIERKGIRTLERAKGHVVTEVIEKRKGIALTIPVSRFAKLTQPDK